MFSRLSVFIAFVPFAVVACSSSDGTSQANDEVNAAPPPVCLGLPTCDPAHEVEVDKCAAGDASCQSRSVCGHTIFCKKNDSDVKDEAPYSRASGYDFEGPKALPNDTAPVELCAQIVSPEQEACVSVQGQPLAANGCKTLCSKPIAPAGKVAGYDFTGFQKLDVVADQVCPQVVRSEQVACGKAGGTYTRAASCNGLCSVPIAKAGFAAGFDEKGFKIAPNDKVTAEFCAAVVNPVQEKCAKVSGKISGINGCGLLCSLPL